MLKAKRLFVDTFQENIAFIHRKCPYGASLGLKAATKVSLSCKSKSVMATLNIVEGEFLLPEEIGLSESAVKILSCKDGDSVRLSIVPPPHSISFVKKKIAGEILGEPEMDAIIHDIITNRYSKVEMTAFVVSTSMNNLERGEILALTKAMVKVGKRLSFGNKVVVDKHCIGGIPGNRTSMIVVPIIASFGLLIPKTSSRAITSPAGTADTMEVLANVTLSVKEMHRVVEEVGGCLVWGGALELSPADDIIIQVERPLGLDSQGQMVASILSKKIAAGSSQILIDIPVGPLSKVKNYEEAARLKRLFEYVASNLGIVVEVVLSDGTKPIGRGIGPLLEAIDVMKVLQNKSDAPPDLREKSLTLAGRILEFSEKVRGGEGKILASEILSSGRAFEYFEKIRRAQGYREPPSLSKNKFTIQADKSGIISSFNIEEINKLARLGGAPMEVIAGVQMLNVIGDKIKKGDEFLEIYAGNKSQLEFAKDYCSEGIEILQVI